jgi:hypothetical protein
MVLLPKPMFVSTSNTCGKGRFQQNNQPPTQQGAITASVIPCNIFLSDGHTVAKIPPSFAVSPTTK